jgi:hypothetical protein
MVMSFSPAYLSSYNAFTSLAVNLSLKGMDNVDIIPLNHGATDGMNASFSELEGSTKRFDR